MKTFESTFIVEWVHCDTAGIVFYSHFYTWFDQSTERMFKAMGYTYPFMSQKFGISGMPLLETGATYRNACQLGDELKMKSWVDEFEQKTFLVKHTLHHADGRLALEGFERRVMAAPDPTSARGIKATAIPVEIITLFGAE